MIPPRQSITPTEMMSNLYRELFIPSSFFSCFMTHTLKQFYSHYCQLNPHSHLSPPSQVYLYNSFTPLPGGEYKLLLIPRKERRIKREMEWDGYTRGAKIMIQVDTLVHIAQAAVHCHQKCLGADGNHSERLLSWQTSDVTCVPLLLSVYIGYYNSNPVFLS